ncbi:MAG TPA: PhzF family phenazine biosynthesis protein [Dongiaceae bacterium]|nr:PhzF family phenazine biosynthesis protein [Dongiaceae bacterium]
MRIPLFHVDAFAGRPFRGNPAAVCFLDSWLDEAMLRKVAAENNLPETAFLVTSTSGYELRWFTPTCEVRLCGHATLAAAYILLNVTQKQKDSVCFTTKYSGMLTVRKDGEYLLMDFPALIPRPCTAPPALEQALGLPQNAKVSDVLEADETYYVVVQSPDAVRSLCPDFSQLATLHPFTVAATAKGVDADFISRYFAPSYGVPEDAVTGSSHCALAPYWTKHLGKSQLHALQVSERGGELWCEATGTRVLLKGKAVLTLKGSLMI